MKAGGLLRHFASDKRGASAIEFALITPVLAVVLLGIAEYGYIAYQRSDMHGALRTGGQYVMNGGRDLDTAEALAVRSWSSKPEDGAIEATRFCLCTQVEHVCTAPCSDGSIPEAYITLRARATLGGVVVDVGEDASDAIRIR